MSRTDFDNFVQRKQEEEKEATAFDPKRELADWLRHLDALYAQIAEFLKSYADAGTARLELRDIELNEEFSGPYLAKQLFLRIGSSTVTFRPIGTMLIGSKGRVDVQGPRGNARLVLINKKITSARQLITVRVVEPGRPPLPEVKSDGLEWAWKIVTPAPEMKFIDLNEEAFFDMVLSVADA